MAGASAGMAAAGDLDGPFIRFHRAGDGLDHRRLARTVLADDRVDLAGVERDRNFVERYHARISLGDSME